MHLEFIDFVCLIFEDNLFLFYNTINVFVIFYQLVYAYTFGNVGVKHDSVGFL